MTSHQLLRPAGCPHCFAYRVAPHHFRDTGDMTSAEVAAELGYCPVLFERRRPRSVELVPSDARQAARLDEWAARLDDDDMAAAFDAAMKAEVL